jgi:hypothetical protein
MRCASQRRIAGPKRCAVCTAPIAAAICSGGADLAAMVNVSEP